MEDLEDALDVSSVLTRARRLVDLFLGTFDVDAEGVDISERLRLQCDLVFGRVRRGCCGWGCVVVSELVFVLEVVPALVVLRVLNPFDCRAVGAVDTLLSDKTVDNALPGAILVGCWFH